MPRPSASQSQSQTQHGLNDDDIEKMVSDAVFYFLVADQKKSIIKVNRSGLQFAVHYMSTLFLFREQSCVNIAT